MADEIARMRRSVHDRELVNGHLLTLFAICLVGIVFSFSLFNDKSSTRTKVLTGINGLPKVSVLTLTDTSTQSSMKNRFEHSDSSEIEDPKSLASVKITQKVTGSIDTAYLAKMSSKIQVSTLPTVKDPVRSYAELTELEKISISCPRCIKVLDHLILISGNSIGRAELVDLIRARDDTYYPAYYLRSYLGMINPKALNALLYYEASVGEIMFESGISNFISSPGYRSISEYISRDEENSATNTEFEGFLEGLDLSALSACASKWLNDHISQGDELKVRDIGFAHQHCGEGLFPLLL